MNTNNEVNVSLLYSALDEVRNELGFSLEYLRLLTGSDYSRMFIDGSNISYKKLIKLCRILSVPPGSFITTIEFCDRGLLQNRDLLDIIHNIDKFKNDIKEAEAFLLGRLLK